jgi:hypothetical protein
VITVVGQRDETAFVVAQSGHDWQALARVGVAARDSAGEATLEIRGWTGRRAGAARVLEVRARWTRTAIDDAANVRESDVSEELTVCRLGASAGCALQLAIEREHGGERVDPARPVERGLTQRWRRRLAVVVSGDDHVVATVTLVEGARDDSLEPLLRRHRLW